MLVVDPRALVVQADGAADLAADLREELVGPAVVDPFAKPPVPVDPGEGNGHPVAAAAAALELLLQDLLEAAVVQQPGEQVGAGHRVERAEERVDPLAHHPHQQAGHDQRDREDDPADDLGPERLVAEGEDGAVGDTDEHRLQGGLEPAQEVEGVERDPHVEEEKGAGWIAGRIDRPLDQHRAAEEENRQGPRRQPVVAGEEQQRDQRRAAARDPDARRADVVGDRRRQRRRRHEGANDEEVHERACGSGALGTLSVLGSTGGPQAQPLKARGVNRHRGTYRHYAGKLAVRTAVTTAVRVGREGLEPSTLGLRGPCSTS